MRIIRLAGALHRVLQVWAQHQVWRLLRIWQARKAWMLQIRMGTLMAFLAVLLLMLQHRIREMVTEEPREKHSIPKRGALVLVC